MTFRRMALGSCLRLLWARRLHAGGRDIRGIAVSARLTAHASTVRRLAELSDPQPLDQPGRYLPQSALDAVRCLVPCDDVAYQVQDIARRTMDGVQDLGDWDCSAEQ